MFKRLLLAGAVLASSWLGVAEAQYTHQPSGATVLVDTAWNTTCSEKNWVCVYPGGGSIISDLSAPTSPPNVMRYQRTFSTTTHGANHPEATYYFPGGGVTSFYMGFWWKMSSPFYGMPHCFNKLMLVWNDTPGQPTLGKFYNFGFNSPSGAPGCQGGPFYPMGILNYEPLDNTQTGAVGNQNLFAGSAITQGEYHFVEICHVMSSTPTSKNGQYYTWVDRNPTHKVDNMNYPGKFTRQVITPVWDCAAAQGATANSCSANLSTVPAGTVEYHYFDHVRIATGFSSCGDTPPPPPPPTEQCRDGIDNDGDGKTDYPADPGCFNELDNFEGDDPPTQVNGQITLSPTSVSASVVAGGAAQVNVSLSKTGTNQNTWSPSSSTAWITTSPPLGGTNTITTETDVLTVTLNAAGKSPGQYTGNITIIETGNNINNTLAIPVTMTVVSEQAVELDKTSFSKCSSNCSSINVQHTVSDKPDRAVYITVDWFHPNPASISYVRFNGVDAQLVDSHTNSNCPYYCNTQIWRLKNPPVGTYNATVAVSPAVPLVVNVASFYNVHQTTSEGTPVKAGGSGTGPSVTLSSATNEKIIGTLAIRDAGGTVSPGSGVTFISNQQDGNGFIRGVAGHRTGGASVQFNASYPPSGGFSILAVPIKPSAPVTPPPPVDPPPSSPVITSVVGSTVNFTHDGLDLAGFKVYYSSTSGAMKTDAGVAMATSARSFVYQAGCYQLSAYDLAGNESSLSAEMCSSAAVVSAVTSLTTSSASSLRVVDWKGRAWELRGTKLPYMLYMDGSCGACDVIGYSLRYNKKLKTVEVEFLPGRWIRRDVAIDDWLILKDTAVTSPADVVKALVTGTFVHDGVNVSGFNVYRSDLTGQTKTKLSLSVGASARTFSDSQNTFGCYEVTAFDSTLKEGVRSNESCTDASPTGPLDVGQISALKVIDFAGRTWELQGASAPYALYRNGVLEGSIVGYSLRYRTGVVEVEDLPGHWIRRDEGLGDWVVVAP